MQNNIVPASYLYVTALNMEGVRKYSSIFSVRKTSSKEEKQEMRGVEYKSLELGKGGRMQPARIPWPARGSAWPSGDLKWGWGPLYLFHNWKLSLLSMLISDNWCQLMLDYILYLVKSSKF